MPQATGITPGHSCTIKPRILGTHNFSQGRAGASGSWWGQCLRPQRPLAQRPARSRAQPPVAPGSGCPRSPAGQTQGPECATSLRSRVSRRSRLKMTEASWQRGESCNPAGVRTVLPQDLGTGPCGPQAPPYPSTRCCPLSGSPAPPTALTALRGL